MEKSKTAPEKDLCIKVSCEAVQIEEDGEIILVPENCDDCDICIQSCQMRQYPKNHKKMGSDKKWLR